MELSLTLPDLMGEGETAAGRHHRQQRRQQHPGGIGRQHEVEPGDGSHHHQLIFVVQDDASDAGQILPFECLSQKCERLLAGGAVGHKIVSRLAHVARVDLFWVDEFFDPDRFTLILGPQFFQFFQVNNDVLIF